MWARECLRVLKPGGYLLAFNATRCFHRMTTGLEDAGFDVRDTLHWTHGNGFPWGTWPWRAMDRAAGHEPAEAPASEAGKAWSGCHTGLRPSHELIAVCRKPLEGPIHANLATHGVGAYGIGPLREEDGGRWPTNTILSHGPTCTPEGCQDGCPVAALEKERPGAAAYFTVLGPEAIAPVLYSEKAKASARTRGAAPSATLHPTVKPEALMARLVRLVTPAGANAVVLDPFAGSGTTGRAALSVGRRAILIERDEAYLSLIRQRVTNLQLPLFAT
jgi:site-specific DNA-methyltransferase (adenine-specific)